jgi:hypothetical protein
MEGPDQEQRRWLEDWRRSERHRPKPGPIRNSGYVTETANVLVAVSSVSGDLLDEHVVNGHDRVDLPGGPLRPAGLPGSDTRFGCSFQSGLTPTGPTGLPIREHVCTTVPTAVA